tara:strand:- start:2795 stop:4315 length:1521 start_codon:yes stop_codon:yes gene_type:complete
MGALIEVKYFNNFLLRKISENSTKQIPFWDGSRGIPQTIGGYRRQASSDVEESVSWVVEEARIRGGYNNTNVSYGPKAYLVEDEPNGTIRENSLIYSGIFNSRTGINNTNVFSVGDDITKSADPANGSIQKLYAEDTNLIIFQESKVSRALIDKDAIYSAEGGGAVTSINTTIGTIQPYAGNFGISKNPESFAVYGYRKYFTDRNRNAVLRLSLDGITEINNYGMYDFFRDKMGSRFTTKLIGGWDIHNKQYVVSMQSTGLGALNSYSTLAFDEVVRGWTSFFTYMPDFVFSLRDRFYSLKNEGLWQHYSTFRERGKFYDDLTAGPASNWKTSITFIFNPHVSIEKSFQTVNYEGSNGWEATSFVSDITGENQKVTGNTTLSGWDSSTDVTSTSANPTALSYNDGEYAINPADGQPVSPNSYIQVFGSKNPPVNRYYAGFVRKENKYVANLVNRSTANTGEVSFGANITGIKAYFATVTFSTDITTNLGGAKELFAVSSNYVQSSY